MKPVSLGWCPLNTWSSLKTHNSMLVQASSMKRRKKKKKKEKEKEKGKKKGKKWREGGHVPPTQSCVGDFHDHICGTNDIRDWSVLDGDFLRAVKHNGSHSLWFWRSHFVAQLSIIACSPIRVQVGLCNQEAFIIAYA